jgi:tetratricopeptide (TPR) repeat protein
MNEAIKFWKDFIALKPDVPDAYVHLGTAYFQIQEYPGALKAAQKALELAPGMKEARYNYCLCEFILGNIEKTKSGLENLKKSCPEFLPARLVLAAADICCGDIEKGLDEIKQLKHTGLSANLVPTLKDLALRLKNEKQTAGANILSWLVLENSNFSGTQ